MTRKIKVGIIQQANTKDLRTNLMNLAKSIEHVRRMGLNWLFCRSCITLCISVRRKTRSCSTWQNRFPVLLRDSIQSCCCQRYCAGHFSVRETRSRIVSYTAVVLNVTAALPGNTGRCIFLMTPPIMRNSILLPVI